MFSDSNSKNVLMKKGLENPRVIGSNPVLPICAHGTIQKSAIGFRGFLATGFVATVRLVNRNSGMVTAAIRSCHSRSVAQFGRALVLGARGREFKSLHSDDQ